MEPIHNLTHALWGLYKYVGYSTNLQTLFTNMRSFSYSFLSILIILHVILPSLITNHHGSVSARPLSTDSRWIVDESGQRVKLSCVNWVAHLETMLAEGLSKQPVDVISKQILSMGFNCVRLTWPLYLFTNDSLANLTVRKSFQNLGLFESVAGIQANNPSIIDLPLINAYQVNSLFSS